ncbi:anaphase-promoting complex subunit cdc27 [Apophysomyces sp. BC1015]|nr:anaphase-promoting complex subunit cdc27 [Apophysomyces sp. BC1015]KAG0178012.1 anaphase-promoting complex subunit cdc27 [Apophysomyces sp. BC1021]
MKEEPASSVDAWVLMALIYKDMDDLDYRNALTLSERLYAMDKTNEEYRFLYAKCLHLISDYDGSYLLLQNTKSVPCLNLFARSCLDLGNRQESYERRQTLWREGVAALDTAIKQHKGDTPEKHAWGDELCSVATRSHMPSLSSMYNLLGEFYAKLDNIRGSAIQLWKSLECNRYKLSAYFQLCDISPDIVGFNTARLPNDIFRDFLPDTTNLKRSTFNQNLPASPSSSVQGIVVSSDDEHPLQSQIGTDPRIHMPTLRSHYQDISVNQLKSLLYSSKLASEQDISDIMPSRSDLEDRKDRQIESMRQEIEKDKAEEAFKNKHGLHKKPPIEKPQGLRMDMIDIDVDDQDLDLLTLLDGPPRVHDIFAEENLLGTREFLSSQNHAHSDYPLRGKGKRAAVQMESAREASKRRRTHDPSLRRYFCHDSSSEEEGCVDEIVNAMNRVMAVLRILANGYLCQSLYQCQDAALELQKLDDQQYDTPLVMYTLGKAYYDAGDSETVSWMCFMLNEYLQHEQARVFFRRSFATAPWFCDVVPIYSTCLWYLEDKQELNLLVYKMKENQTHKYEAYIAAGNWSKCAEGGNHASRWFKKAIEDDPSRWYAHALVGYEEWEKGSFLAAKQHFTDCMIANKRHYLGWYGMATAYLGMDEYIKAKALLKEALRLHQHHPVILFTMAEILYALEEYEDASHFVCQSLKLKPTVVAKNLREKIEKVKSNNYPDE